ncbi:hypothetical protein [Muricoccus vinaceus]|uniref:Nucleotidyl transferase AbiEii/AbiGii toxin family protein n=1 Tax=Muricoccus vinaceus TaxID=424704 RepID=A0ABV6IVJ3_9PROT
MPLDDFQKSVLRTLMPLRSPGSVFAGGTVIQQHGFRLSDDQDIFHDAGEDVIAIAERDVAELRKRGFDVSVGRAHEGLVEAVVARGNEGRTKLQWVEAGSWHFFSPVPDPEFGWRLHMADLAVNKALAAGGRKQVRDYVDLFMIHRHVMPLWSVLWAAPGKDDAWSPLSLAEKIAMTNGFRQADIDEAVLATVDISAAEVGRTVRAAIEEAMEVFQRLPDDTAGCLFVDEEGGVVTDATAVLSGVPGIRGMGAAKGGAWPSGPGIDYALIQRVIEAFGWEGSNPRPGHDPGSPSEPGRR